LSEIARMEKVLFVDKKDAGYVVKHLNSNTIHLIPEYMLIRRMEWGLYELINKEQLPFVA